MATIRKRNGRYQVQVRRKEFNPISKSFLRLKDAQEWARHIEISQDRNELVEDMSVLMEVTLGDLVRKYRDEVSPKKKGGWIEVITLNSFLKHDICRRSIAKVSVSDFAKYR